MSSLFGVGRIDEEAPVRMVLISGSAGSVLEDRMLVWIVWNDGWRFMSKQYIGNLSVVNFMPKGS